MKDPKVYFTIILTAIVILLSASYALAQKTLFTIENVPNVVSVGVGMVPDYEGSNNYKVGAAPFFKLTYPKAQWCAQLIATQLYVNVLDHAFLRFGPVGNYRFGAAMTP